MNPAKKKSVVLAVISLALLLLAYLAFMGVTSKKEGEVATVPPQSETQQLVAFGKQTVENLSNEAKEITIPVIKKGEILPASVKTVIFFCEKADGELRNFTKASVSSKWSNPPDWNDSEVENIQISYPGPLDPSKESYAGFIIGLYYENELQDQISEPKALIENFPLPKTIKGRNIR